MKMKLYEILKNFVEKEAHIRMPKLEKCEYFEMTGIYHDDTMSEWCSDNNKQCENCKNCPHKAQCIKHNARCNTPLE